MVYLCGGQCWVTVRVARFARRHLWGICAAVSVGSQCVVTRFARRHLRGICAAVSVGSQRVVARFAQRHLKQYYGEIKNEVFFKERAFL